MAGGEIFGLVGDPWLGFAWEWSAFAVVVAFLAGSAALALRFFRWE